MTILGNIFLVLSLFIYCFFLYTIYVEDGSQERDSGYGMAVLLFSLIFTGLMAVVMFAVTAKGGFDWMSANPVSRNFVVVISFVSAMIIMSMSALFKYEGGRVPFPINYLVNHAAVWIPVVLLLSSIILLNAEIKASVPSVIYTIPLKIVFGISVLSVVGLLIGWMISSQQSANRRIATIQDDQVRYHAGYLADIAANDTTQGILPILVFTGKYHEADVREAALAKIRSHPDWQQQLIKILDSYYASEVFTLLEASPVDDKSLFVEPIQKGILQMAKRFRDDMRNTHTLHADEFDGDTRRILATVDQFEGLGVDYKPAIQALRDALDEPRTQKIKLNSTAMLDRWLKAHN